MSKLTGKTKIELTDVRSGEKEVHEKHNMVTNALSDIFKPIGLFNDPGVYYDSLIPYYTTLLGGLLLFDKSLEEDPDNYFPPADAALVGCGVYNKQSAVSNIYQGSYNTLESEINAQDRYVKYVYDYTTNQANGTIASVCLTNVTGGYTSYEAPKATTEDSTTLVSSISSSTLNYVYPGNTGADTKDRSASVQLNNEYIFLMDKQADVALYFKFTDTTHLHIIKRRLFLKSVSIFDNIKTTKPLVEDKELDVLTKPITIGYSAYNYDTATNKLYISSNKSSEISVGSDFDVLEVDCTTWEVTQYTLKNNTEKTITANYLYLYVTAGYIYTTAASYSSNTCYKINIKNDADVLTINYNESSLYFQHCINGRIFCKSGSRNVYVLNTNNNTLCKTGISIYDSSDTYSVTPVLGEKNLFYLNYNYTSMWCCVNNYLATINNLDVPVTKTAEKTMKITYILQEE